MATAQDEDSFMTLCAKNVSLSRGANSVLVDVSCRAEVGRTTVIVGANGSGKSSLLRTLTGEYSPDEGTVMLDGEDIANLTPMAQARRRALMSQNPYVSFDFLVSEILEMGWVQRELPHKYLSESVSHVSRLCGIEEFLNRPINGLSGGEQQRVHFARALLQVWNVANDYEPRYLLLDEPTSSLDIAYELDVLKLAKLVSRQGLGTLVVLHDLNLAARFADYVYLLVDGMVFQEGTVREVFTDEVLSETYQFPIKVEHHVKLNRLLVIAN